MRRLIALICSLPLLAPPAPAQYLRKYIFIAPVLDNGAAASVATFGILPAAPSSVAVASNNAYSAGGGFEYQAKKWIGVGLDLAGLIPSDGKVISNTTGTVSPNVFFHVPQANWQGSTWDAYTTGGYTALFRDFGANGVNVGGGLNYWFHEQTGVMFEFRFVRVLGSNPPTPATNYYEIRFGLNFR